MRVGRRGARGDRGVSPVVGSVLLVAIAILLASALVYGFLSLGEEREPQPDVALDLEAADDGVVHRLVHEQGDRLDGEQVTLRGAADPDALGESALTAGGRVELYAVDSEIEVVYTGDHGTTYLLGTFEAERRVPAPDEGCDWVDSETSGGSDDATVDGIVVDCTVDTDGVITVRNDGVVIGDTTSGAKNLDADDARVYGDVAVEKDVNLQDGTVTGSVTARTEQVKLGNGTVEGAVDAAKLVELADGSSAGGDVTSDTKGVKVLDSEVDGSITAVEDVKVDAGTVEGPIETANEIEVIAGSSVDGDLASDDDQVKVLNSEVSGAVVTEGNVKLDGATVEGDVYVGGSFDCTDSTVDGQDCDAYSPKDPDDY